MTRKLPVLLLPLFLLVFVTSVSAQNTTAATVADTKTQTATDAATKLKLQTQLIREEKKAAVAQVKDEAKAAIQAKREEFKVKIQTIKDQAKKSLVARIDAKIAEVNANQTTKYLAAIASLQGFLDKVKLSATGAGASVDITAAQAAIDAAKSAAEAQAAKTYTMAITDDATLRANAGATVSQFRLDLSAVHKLIVNARQAVKKLFPEIIKTEKETLKINREATKSANL